MFSREELKGMTLRQLRLIDIKEVEDERLVQELINQKTQKFPHRDVYRGDAPDIKTPEEEAEYQKKLDARVAEKKQRELANEIPTGDTQVDSGEQTGGDDKSINKNVEETSDEKLMDITLTQEDLDDNPELVEQGLKVGDVVQIPAVEKDKVEDEGKPKEDDPKDGDKTGPIFCAECGSKRKGKHKKNCPLNVE